MNLVTKEEMYSKVDVIIDEIKLVTDNKQILIITHDDLDGLVSAYCFEKYFLEIGFEVKVNQISVNVLEKLEDYFKEKPITDYKTILVLDIFDERLIKFFENKNWFAIDHHDTSKEILLEKNTFNIANFFKDGIVPSMGAFSFGYTRNKINYPKWLSMVARFSDGLYQVNDFFVNQTSEEIEINNFMGLPRAEVIEFISFINAFYNNPINVDLYVVFKECVDSNNLLYFMFSDSKDIVYLRKLKVKLDKLKTKLLNNCLKKNKKYEAEKLVIFELNEKENGVRRNIQSTLEFIFYGYNLLFLIKTNEGYVFSYRTNTTKFDVVANLKSTYESYTRFGGHSFAVGGFFKSEFKKRFIKDTINVFKKYYER